MTLKERLANIYDALLKAYGPQECCLVHTTPFELLVATVLSAQCTDKKVNSVTPALFRRFPTPSDFADADIEEIESCVKVCGFYHAKTKHIQELSRVLCEKYASEVPQDMDELVKLPGVGRKTANVVLGDAFGIPGLPVDTHVKRIMNLTGAADSDNPQEIEAKLCKNLPRERWSAFSHLVIIHGRTRCPARRPDCASCEIAAFCKHASKLSMQGKK